MKKLKLEKLKSKHEFFSKFNILTRSFAYLPACMLIGWLSSFWGVGLALRIVLVVLACFGWDLTTRLIWSKAKQKAEDLEQEIAEYAETEQGEKEVVLLANIESVQEILKDKDCKIKEPCERLLKKLLETKYKMTNPLKIKVKDLDSGKSDYIEVVDDSLMEEMEQAIDEMANECGLNNLQEE